LEDKVYYLADNFSLFQGDFNHKKFFLFDISEGSIYRLNQVSYDMLSLFDGEKKLSEIFSSLIIDYDVEEAKLREDLNSMVENWINKSILKLKMINERK